jgi:anti-sigma B factor antagonist
MEMKTLQTNGITVIELSGRFDAYAAPQLEKYFKLLYAEANKENVAGVFLSVVIDLAHVNFVDSSGLACMIQGMKNCRKYHGDVHLCNLQQGVRIIIELTRLDKVFSIFPTQNEAMEAFSREYQSQLIDTP